MACTDRPCALASSPPTRQFAPTGTGARMAVSKIYPDVTAALADLLHDGMVIMSGGFGLCGIPAALIEAIRESGVKGLTIISNNAGIDEVGLGVLLQNSAGAQDDQLLCRGERDLREAVPRR